MKNKRKAILLSALVLPGLGQVILKRYKRGIAIIIVTGFSLYRLLDIVMQQANDAVNNLLAQGGRVDMQVIHQAASQSAGGSDYSIYLNIIILCWFISLLDIWIVWKKT